MIAGPPAQQADPIGQGYLLGILVATAIPVLLFALVVTGVVGSTVHSGHSGGYDYVVTDMQGNPIADAGPWFVPGDVSLLGFVALPVVLLVGFCIVLNRHAFRRIDGSEPAPMPRAAPAVATAVIYSLVAVLSGVYLVSGTLPVHCTACTHPEWIETGLREAPPSDDSCVVGYGPRSSDVSLFFQPSQATGIVGVQSVTCPAPFQQVADRRRAVYYGAGGALIAIGLVGIVTMGFLVQPMRFRSAPKPTARASPPA